LVGVRTLILALHERRLRPPDHLYVMFLRELARAVSEGFLPKFRTIPLQIVHHYMKVIVYFILLLVALACMDNGGFRLSIDLSAVLLDQLPSLCLLLGELLYYPLLL